ncbi:unnamed protein product [Brassica napus]|uniref:(rape) hypothetical protein n=1 Tax=Brassica napus TaxID=3708 RepID=A0A816I9M4_BRANA|nr:unnamed protein product [Brassica napus]
MKLQIKVDEKTGQIVDARFKTFGCGSAIASSSVATEWVKRQSYGGSPDHQEHVTLQGFISSNRSPRYETRLKPENSTASGISLLPKANLSIAFLITL